MLYFLYGQDSKKSRDKAHELFLFLQKKKPNASLFKLNRENFTPDILSEYVEGRGLFEEKYIVFLDEICSDKNIKEKLLGKIEDISKSANVFVLLEGKLDKTTASKIEKFSEKTQNFELTEKIQKEPYNAFALADAFGNRDRKTAWMLYRKAIDRGEAPEALHGMLFWKAKTLALSSAGIYDKEEIMKIIEKLVIIYHESRRGNGEIETKVETFLLEL